MTTIATQALGAHLPFSLLAMLARRRKLNGAPGMHYGVALLDSTGSVLSVLDIVKGGAPSCRSLTEFSGGLPVEFIESPINGVELEGFASRVSDLDLGRLGWTYHLMARNCEHFARFLLRGESTSKQVSTLALIALFGAFLWATN